MNIEWIFLMAVIAEEEARIINWFARLSEHGPVSMLAQVILKLPFECHNGLR